MSIHIYAVYVEPILGAKSVNQARNVQDINVSERFLNKYMQYLVVPILATRGL